MEITKEKALEELDEIETKKCEEIKKALEENK